MELDDFRRRWQEQPSGPAPTPETTEQNLRAMLAQRTTGPIAQLKQNVQRDMKLSIPILLLNLFNLLNILNRKSLTTESRLMFVGLVAALLVMLAASMYRRLQLVRQMEGGSADLYNQLKTTSQKLRQVLRTSWMMGIGVLLVVCGMFLYKTHAEMLAYLSPGAEHWGRNVTVFILGCTGFAAVVTALFVVGKAKQQRRYGRYLDQLEGALRELEA
ncbi:hypothetical protein HMJ29_11775 [Hymenobacter taeanensis]|uniref:Uncharacterized protein n=1 Tax=Hymenobacter taeanensis TaxID=2735321 RepID=A0A6M6BGD5_9BACT|nr:MULTISPECIES: hypothetical protein [Hymenobacter]QJX47581.1 hypothetical protein HMJ29_11775 [Hymenobacter taeanensis]UOQ82935.1 hypothetical protein MUN83_09310 [Hymenobacter sp. 5414T-23]